MSVRRRLKGAQNVNVACQLIKEATLLLDVSLTAFQSGSSWQLKQARRQLARQNKAHLQQAASFWLIKQSEWRGIQTPLCVDNTTFP